VIAAIVPDVTDGRRAGFAILGLLAGIGCFFLPSRKASVTAAAGSSRVILAYLIPRSRP